MEKAKHGVDVGFKDLDGFASKGCVELFLGHGVQVLIQEETAEGSKEAQ